MLVYFNGQELEMNFLSHKSKQTNRLHVREYSDVFQAEG